MQVYLESRLLFLKNKLQCNVEEGAEAKVVAQMTEKIGTRTFSVPESNSLSALLQDSSILGEDSKLQLGSAILKQTREADPVRGRPKQGTTSAGEASAPTYQCNNHSEHLGKVLSS